MVSLDERAVIVGTLKCIFLHSGVHVCGRTSKTSLRIFEGFPPERQMFRRGGGVFTSPNIESKGEVSGTAEVEERAMRCDNTYVYPAFLDAPRLARSAPAEGITLYIGRGRVL